MLGKVCALLFLGDADHLLKDPGVVLKEEDDAVAQNGAEMPVIEAACDS